MPSATSVTARRCAVLLAMPSRFASALMPISTSSSENALSSRIAVVTEDSRSRLRGSVLPVDFLAMARPSTGWRVRRCWNFGARRAKQRCSAMRTVVPNLGARSPPCQSGRANRVSEVREVMSRRIVIVGGGPAGVGAALGARQQDADRRDHAAQRRERASPTRSRRCRRPCSPARRCRRTRRSPGRRASPAPTSRSSRARASDRPRRARGRHAKPANASPTTRWCWRPARATASCRCSRQASPASTICAPPTRRWR